MCLLTGVEVGKGGKRPEMSAWLFFFFFTYRADGSHVGKGSRGMRGEKRKGNSQQRQRDVALQARLELDLDVEVEPELQPHRLGVGQALEDGRVAQAAAGLGQLPVVTTAAAAARVNRRGLRGGVVELFRRGGGEEKTSQSSRRFSTKWGRGEEGRGGEGREKRKEETRGEWVITHCIGGR